MQSWIGGSCYSMASQEESKEMILFLCSNCYESIVTKHRNASPSLSSMVLEGQLDTGSASESASKPPTTTDELNSS